LAIELSVISTVTAPNNTPYGKSLVVLSYTYYFSSDSRLFAQYRPPFIGNRPYLYIYTGLNTSLQLVSNTYTISLDLTPKANIVLTIQPMEVPVNTSTTSLREHSRSRSN
jgi:hypothetical protein